MRTFAALTLVAAAIFSSPTVAGAGEKGPVSVRQVTLAAEVPLDESTVRTALGVEIDGLDKASLAKKHAAVLSVSVRKSASPASVEYVVSAVVIDARGGSMLGVVEGRASTRISNGRLALDRSVLQTAAHSAIANVPSVLR